MLKENELRIGNLVYNDKDEIMKIARIETKEYTDWNSGDDDSITYQHLTNIGCYFQGNIKPIPLTENILLKLGFKLFGGWYFYEYFDDGETTSFCIKFDSNNNLFAYHTEVKDNRPLIYVYTTHQLQNLFFCLTGFELCVVS